MPGGILIDLPHDAYDERIKATREAIDAGATVIYEAAFNTGGVFVAVDILAREGSRWRLIEVKSTLSAKAQHLPDLAVQVHVVRESGLDVFAAEVMFLNRDCRFPDLSNLFTRQDRTAQVEALLPMIRQQIHLQRIMLAGELPVVETGAHCAKPYPCPFHDRCHEPLPKHHVSALYRISRRRAAEWAEAGFKTIADLPESLELQPVQRRQRRAIVSGATVVEAGLSAVLAGFAWPVAFLDFETVGPAIPVWDGCGPYSAVPTQFSCHIVDAQGSIRHVEWIADCAEDPRPGLTEALLEATRDVERVVTWNSSFEKQCIEGLAAAVPHRAGELRALATRIIDLLPVVRDHVYHPDFDGGFGFKAVLPALVPGVSHANLEIGNANLASAELLRMMFAPQTMTAAERDALRGNLLRYCELDTLGMVKVLEVLREVA